ncbi:MAG: acyl-CoA dehydrogenase family protein [Acidobacteriota bacterium]
MNFEPSIEQQAARERARHFARETLQAEAAEIDQTGVIPDALQQGARALMRPTLDAVAKVLVVEELAAASAAVGLLSAAQGRTADEALNLSGLRGAPMSRQGAETALLLAAVALGIGRAALDQALDELRSAETGRGADTDKPHWLVADVATDLEAARLLTHRAATEAGGAAFETASAVARLMACRAALACAEAAIRVSGASGLAPGGLLDRLTRDARALSVVLGSEEHVRSTAAAGLLPG